MSKHTHGPWEMRTASNGDVGVRAAGYDGVIAEFFAELHRRGEQRPEEAQANARLFLAAPELLAACVEALGSGAHSKRIDRLLQAAIAKARGE